MVHQKVLRIKITKYAKMAQDLEIAPTNSPIPLMILIIFTFLLSSMPISLRKFSTIFSSEGSLQAKVVGPNQYKEKEKWMEQPDKINKF